jgi:O-antigen/teichoic acid export membrane protein
MSETAKRVMQNSVLRIGGYSIGAGLHFAIIVIIARYLGAEGFGHFAFILAFTGIFQLIVDMGIRNILIRNIAVDKANAAEKLSVARTLFWMLSLVSMGLIVLIANLLPLSNEVRQSTYIAGLAVITTFHALGYSAALRAFEEMDLDILGFVLHKVVFMGLVLVVSKTALGLKGAFMAMLIANGCLYFYYRILVGARYGRARFSLDLNAGWLLLKESFPLGIAEVLRRVTRHIDKLLLTALVTPVAVGLFSAAYKFLEAIGLFTNNLTISLFPVFSRLAKDSNEKLFKAYEQSLKFLYIMAIPVAVIFFIFAERIVMLFFGESYREAAVVLMILSPAVVVILLTSIYGYLFTALGFQRKYTVCAAIALVVNTLLDVMLIPFYSYNGAAIGTLAAEIALFISGAIMLRRMGAGFVGIELIWRPLIAGLCMGLVCYLFKDGIIAYMLLGAIGGLAVYAAVLLILQTFDKQELILLRDAMRIRQRSAI